MGYLCCFNFNCFLRICMGSLVVRPRSPFSQLVNSSTTGTSGAWPSRVPAWWTITTRTIWQTHGGLWDVMKTWNPLPFFLFLYSLANSHFTRFTCSDLSHSGPPSLSKILLAGSQPAIVQHTPPHPHYLAVGEKSTMYALNQWGKGGEALLYFMK